MQWFRIDFVHSAANRLLDILIFHVPSDGNDFGLLAPRNIDVFEFVADLFCRFIAVEERHVAIHKDQ